MFVVSPLGDEHKNDVLKICQNLRANDKREIFATRFDSDPEDLLESTMALKGSSWIAYYKDDPVAVFGVMPIAPNVWSAYAFATEQFPRIVISLTRFIKRGIIPSLLASGAKQVQALVWTEYHQARKWLQGFGAQEQTVISNFGKGGEDFALTVWRP